MRPLIIFSFLIILLLLRFLVFYNSKPVYHDKEEISFETVLLSDSRTTGKYQTITANLPYGDKIFITVSVFPKYSYGEKIKISGYVRVQTPNVPGTLNKRLINGKYTIATMFFPKIERVENISITSGLAVTSFVRQRTSSLFNNVLPSTSSSLLLGIVFGIKEGMPAKLKKDLQISGVYHVVAASGMNVSMVGAFMSVLFATFFKRQIALLFTIISLIFYALLAGLDPPILRASIMGIAAFCAQILGRQTLASYSLFLAGYGMLFISPSLLSDVGFQLSFISTLGLLYIKPIFGKKEAFIKSDVTTTISAQIAALPILLATFGTYSLWSVVINALVLWTIPILMIFGGLAAILGLIFAPLGSIFLYLTLPFLLWFEKIVSFSEHLGGNINLTGIPWQIVIGYYLMLLAIVIFIQRRGKAKS
ncbi:MAG: ComEC/Rec2 family competence protein [bacterium]|nr:ComEC/Rec2 family competence protein [bacterium]